MANDSGFFVSMCCVFISLLWSFKRELHRHNYRNDQSAPSKLQKMALLKAVIPMPLIWTFENIPGSGKMSSELSINVLFFSWRRILARHQISHITNYIKKQRVVRGAGALVVWA
jgi:hypothetical protein